MKKRRMILLFLTLCLLSGCEREEAREAPIACVAPEDCFLCGGREGEAWGQNNVGLVSFHTFAVLPIEINRYSEEGAPLAEKTGRAWIKRFQSGEDGFRATGLEDPDRGYAILTVTLGEDGRADRERAAAFLCGACLERILPEGNGAQTALGVVNFATGEARTLDKRTRGFGLGDFYIHCDWEDGGEKAELLVFYSPLR